MLTQPAQRLSTGLDSSTNCGVGNVIGVVVVLVTFMVGGCDQSFPPSGCTDGSVPIRRTIGILTTAAGTAHYPRTQIKIQPTKRRMTQTRCCEAGFPTHRGAKAGWLVCGQIQVAPALLRWRRLRR